MKRLALLIALSCFIYTVFGQVQTDTLYFDKTGQGTKDSRFCHYYRIFHLSENSNERNQFKDFYSTGELRSEGFYLRIDTLNDHSTEFEGTIISYYQNGSISQEINYEHGKPNGPCVRYKRDGAIESRTFYRDGMLEGPCEIYNDDGTSKIIDYSQGKPAHDYYLLSDSDGNLLKFRISDDMPIWENPDITERTIDYYNGKAWEVYRKNGLTIALSDTAVKDYGKWHRIDLVITNNSKIPIDFAPEYDIRAYSMDKANQSTELLVWSCADYIKKVKRAQAWAAALVGFSEGLSTARAGYSTSTTTGYSNNGYFSATTTTYNAAVAAQAQAASQQRIANYTQVLLDERRNKESDYLKRNTVYPGETITGYVYVARNRDEQAFFIVNIEDAEYSYEWTCYKKATFPAR